MPFNAIRGLLSEPETLALETRAHHAIPNEVVPPPSAEDLRLLDFRQSLLNTERWMLRKPRSFGYNCAGHAWASRRTSILEDSAVRMILADDGYRTLRDGEDPIQGDLVLYWNRTTGGQESWMHTGVVHELRGLATSANPSGMGGKGVPWVLSKWSAFDGEWLHRYDDVPWGKDGLVIQFLTDRP
jgi:hypothetical protein